MSPVRELQDQASDLLNQALAASSTSLETLRVPQLLALGARPGPLEHYKHVPAEVRALVTGLGAAEGPEAVRLALYAAILKGMAQTVASDAFTALPERVRRHQLVQYKRILANAKPTDAWLDLSEDTFHKEFGLAVLRLYAAAAQLIDPRCGLPRTVLLKGGLAGLPAASAALLRLGGFSPYFQIHTHTAYLAEFNEEGWNECYRTCADLYAVHPEVLGMFGASWFYDPVLETISPRLAYLSVVPLKGGAERLPFARDGEFVQDAILTSPSRRKLYDEGKYKPESYLLAWGRRAQRAWAVAHPGPAGEAA